jgi:hypothetical protein
MTYAEWRTAAEAHLLERYSLDFEGAGREESYWIAGRELWPADPVGMIEWFAAKYDLEPIDVYYERWLTR